MPYITISAQAEASVRARTNAPIRNAPERNSDGTYTLWLGDDTIERLQKCAFAGEELSDTILRVCTIVGHEMN